jgi:hypothetical protein
MFAICENASQAVKVQTTAGQQDVSNWTSGMGSMAPLCSWDDRGIFLDA